VPLGPVRAAPHRRTHDHIEVEYFSDGDRPSVGAVVAQLLALSEELVSRFEINGLFRTVSGIGPGWRR
jgi:hypothetical protein